MSESRRGWKLPEYARLAISEVNSKKSKPIIGPNGEEYISIKDCSEKVGKSKNTIKNWIKNYPEKGFKFKNNN